jgi:hypothetical protein
MNDTNQEDSQELQEIETNEPTNILGIFEGYNFPQVKKDIWGNGQQPILNPRDIIELETMYATTLKSMKQVSQELADKGQLNPISQENTLITGIQVYACWVQLQGKHEICRSVHSHAKTLKADLLGDEALELYTQDLSLLEDELVSTSEDGSRQIASAGVAFLKGKSEAYLKQARIMERKTHNKKVDERAKAKVVNNNITVNIKDLMNTPIQELLDIDFTQG